MECGAEPGEEPRGPGRVYIPARGEGGMHMEIMAQSHRAAPRTLVSWD